MILYLLNYFIACAGIWLLIRKPINIREWIGIFCLMLAWALITPIHKKSKKEKK